MSAPIVTHTLTQGGGTTVGAFFPVGVGTPLPGSVIVQAPPATTAIGALPTEAPPPEPRTYPTIYVARDYPSAVELSERLGRRGAMTPDKDTIITWPGSDGVRGRRAGRILVGYDTQRAIWGRPDSRAWWYEQLLTRLMPGGQVIAL